MAESDKPGTELNTWKEIASYLKISVRKAQMLESDRGLPVHRGTGPKPPVYAYTGELEMWKARMDSLRKASGGIEEREKNASALPLEALSAPRQPATSQSTDEAPSETSPPRRRWLQYAAVGGLGIGGLLLGMLKAPAKTRRPVRYTIEGSTLSVFAEDGSQLWRHNFNTPLLDPNAALGGSSERYIFADLDGDGRTETLFYYLPDETHGKLICLDDAGDQRWEFTPDRSVWSDGQEYTPPYKVAAYAICALKSAGASRVVVTSNHHYSFPEHVAVLDGKTGRLISDYWHRGHLSHIALVDLQFSGMLKPSIVLGGVNDAKDYKCATLVVFDQQAVAGGSRDPEGKPYFQNLIPGTERAEIFFPRTVISRGKEFNIVFNVRVMGERLAAEVVEDTSERGPGGCVIYEFDRQLQAVNVVLCNETLENYNKLPESHKEPPEELAKRLRSEVKVVWR